MVSSGVPGGLLLAAVFATAGVAKLADLDGSRRAMAAFGLPQRLASPLGTLLPAAELATAALLGAGAIGGTLGGAEWDGVLVAGALSALALLVLFCAGIASSLVRGRAPDCHCFGQLHSAPASGRTLARNGALLSIAAFVASGDPLLTALAATAALAMLAIVTLLSRDRATQGAEQATSEGLPLGSPAPEFELPALEGPPVTLAALQEAGLPVLLVFTDLHCGPCVALAPEIAEWQRRQASEITIAVIENRDGRSLTGPDEHGRRNVLFQRGSEVADRYRAQGTPTAVLVDRDGAIASPVAAGAKQIGARMAAVVPSLRQPKPPRESLRSLCGEFARRELLVRAAGAWAVTSAVLAWPLQAAAGVGSKRQLRAAESCEDQFDCPDPHHMRCRDGRCRCYDGLTRCNPQEATTQRCFDLQRSRDHCGSCNHACTGAAHDVCCEGVCGESGRTRCNCAGDECGGDEICFTNSDGTSSSCINCSDFGWKRCGNECGNPETQRCCGNKLYNNADLGPGDWRCCGPASNRRLVNTLESERNCGGCDRACGQGKFCYGGRCRDKCPPGLKRCGNTCGDPNTQACCNGKVVEQDNGHCGRNCEKCSSSFPTCCNGECVNTSFDDRNCGGCNIQCTAQEPICEGRCICPGGPGQCG